MSVARWSLRGGQTQLGGSYWRGPWGYAGGFGYYSTNYGPQPIGLEAGFTPTEPIKQVEHRWYDPSIGRFLSRDPARDGDNWFSYCANDPVNAADPSGNVIQIAAGVVVLAGVLEVAETCLDVIGLLLDIDDFIKKPGWDTGLSLLWSTAASVIPGIPGSWVGRVAKHMGRVAEATLAESNVAKAVKRYGRRGKADHVKTVSLTEEAIKAENPGWDHFAGGSRPEKLHPDARRYADLWFVDEAGNNHFYQVGRVDGKGRPVAREWDAGDALSKFGQTYFIPVLSNP